MALTVRGLIEKIEKVEDKSGDVFIELQSEFLSVDTVFLDKSGDVTLVSEVGATVAIAKNVKQVKQNFNNLAINKRKQTRYH